MSPAEIMQMKSNEQIMLIEARPPIKAKKYYWFKENRGGVSF
jgi:type IV secretory pathway TraG/TraD family ATPase VirD4